MFLEERQKNNLFDARGEHERLVQQSLILVLYVPFWASNVDFLLQHLRDKFSRCFNANMSAVLVCVILIPFSGFDVYRYSVPWVDE